MIIRNNINLYQLNKYKKLNTDWNTNFNHVMINKENNYKDKVSENIEKIEKKHLKDQIKKPSVTETSSSSPKNINSGAPKIEKINWKLNLKEEVT